MKQVNIIRGMSSDDGTFGKIMVDNMQWFTLELPWKDNENGVSCIPEGDYICHWIISPKHGECYQVMDVPGRSMVEIHSANFAGDASKGKFAELLGCIALGKSIGMLDNPSGAMQKSVMSSKQAIAEFEALMNKEDFELNISRASQQ